MTDNTRAILLMNVAMLAFTLNDACMKAVSETLPLFQAIFLRGVATTLALLGLAAMQGQLRFVPGPGDRARIGWRTLAEVVSTATFLLALTHMPIANLSAIMQALPLAVTLGAALWFGERLDAARLLAIMIGFAGVLLIIRPGTEGFDRWALLGLASMAFVTLRDLMTRGLSRSVPSSAVAVWAALAVAVMGGVVTLQQGWQTVSLTQAALLAGATVNLIIGYLTVVMVMRVGDIGVVAPFRYMALLWAILIGAGVFGAWPDGLTLIGSAIVVASGLFTLLADRLRRQRRTA
ncbi:DMT family transporter [Gemmobacter denitrificans]|uniref:DMT family transporter n=1 Tax=Gemmobacter denitrificans TaxID=3123040 RepID=A0ABU8BXY8_9RHOB